MTSAYDPTSTSESLKDGAMSSPQTEQAGDVNFLPLGTSRPSHYQSVRPSQGGIPSVTESHHPAERYEPNYATTSATSYAHGVISKNEPVAYAQDAHFTSLRGYEEAYQESGPSHPYYEPQARHYMPSPRNTKAYQGSHYAYDTPAYHPEERTHAVKEVMMSTGEFRQDALSSGGGSGYPPSDYASSMHSMPPAHAQGYVTNTRPQNRPQRGYAPQRSYEANYAPHAQGYPQDYPMPSPQRPQGLEPQGFHPATVSPLESSYSGASQGALGANPATSIQPVFNLLVEIGRECEDKVALIEQVQAKVLQWVRDQQCRLPAVAYQGESFQVNYAAFGGAECEAIVERPYWALQFI
ncbi:MAG: hypothetical protein ACKO37_00145, partial [Vampirovibrionales bacterium]